MNQPTKYKATNVVKPMSFWCACGEKADYFANTPNGLLLWCGECVPSDEDQE